MMTTKTTHQGRLSVDWRSWSQGKGAGRRRRHVRGETLRRIEALEDRRLLAATINIDAAALLSYATDSAATEALTISVSGTTYTFSSDQMINVASNVPGLTVTGDGGNVVTVDGITGLAVSVNTASSEVTLLSSNVATEIDPGTSAGASQLNIGAGDLSGLSSVITIAPGGLGTGPDFNVTVDGSAGATAGVWNLAPIGSVSQLTGIGAGAAVTYTPGRIGGFTLLNAALQANSLTVDFAVGNPLPTAIMAYNGGATASSAAKSDLILIGDPEVAFTSETYTTGGGTGGSLQFLDEDSNSTGIDFSGVSSHSVYDTVVVASYVFNYTGDPSVGVTASAGENSANTGNLQTLKIASDGSPAQFVDVHLANKTAVTVNQLGGGDYTSTVNYAITDPVAGLSSLTFVSGSGSDASHLIALPPAVATSVQQGGGSDQMFVTLAGTTAATSTTVDGGPGTDSLRIDAGGLALTASNFTVNPDGSTTVSGAPVTGAGLTYRNYESVTVTDAAAPTPTVFGVPVHGTEGLQLVNVLVGAFTAPGGFKASDFAATVAWGDGKSDAGVIVQDASNPAVYYIYGTHTYQTPGVFTTTITVRPLAGTGVSFIGGIPVTFVSEGGDPVSQSQSAIIQDAGLSLAVQAFSGVENKPLATTSSMIVATFTDLGGIDPTQANPAGQYTATIFWGDGSVGVGSLTITRNGLSSQFIVSAAPHTYTTPGTYTVTVVVKQADGGATAVASNFAHIADAALTAATPLAVNPVTEASQFVDLAISAFNDANPLATVDQYKVLVDYGDGTGLQAATVVQPNGIGTTFYILGTHTYANTLAAGASPITTVGTSPATAATLNGTYTLKIYVQDTFGSAVNLTNTLAVDDRALTVAGTLDSASDTGISNTDGVTNDNTPSFTGRVSEGGSTVALYASLNGGSPFLIGSTSADAAGVWSITPAAALADGGYTISAQAIDSFGHTVGALTTIRSGLVIDTVGPKITNVLLDGWRGQVIVTLEDFGGVSNIGSGLAASAVQDANNYVLTKLLAKNTNLRPWLITSISVSPGSTTGEQVATIQFNGGAQIRGGKYLFKALSVDPTNLSGIRDIAGNALDGEFYGYFPSGNNVNGGNFVAELDAIHHTVYPPKTQVGTATPVSPAGRAATGAYLSSDGTLTPSASAAVKLSAARQVATSARAARLAALRS
ncbi:Ig-like domain-containing protein [Paludisphaera rhizosphaerae]|uniref:Ig-like domain-containing protein n=1 Tax=Paludisphaera rhizosphaerae TaxID=2711216 RepID=UPI0013EC460C|nr:Ig-like domain-containing protein [Paludisphaera rhizosphaerae]